MARIEDIARAVLSGDALQVRSLVQELGEQVTDLGTAPPTATNSICTPRALAVSPSRVSAVWISFLPSVAIGHCH